MSDSKRFTGPDISALQAVMDARPLGTWVTHGPDELIVNHIPFFLDRHRGEHGTLVGHVARSNPVWKAFSTSIPSVIVFHGPQAYIPPSWYPSKEVDGKVVPTWNYVAVHAYGLPRIVDDPVRLREMIVALTAIHEAGQATPWLVSDAPEKFINALMSAIVGIEIPLTKLSGKWEVSQNRKKEDKLAVIAGLQSLGAAEKEELAKLIRASMPVD